ncbi:MAG: guanylate kinase [Candidatus Raymondbacteria bacterium RifOxyC12_full_50_8]|uniref:Guanylate kinase n=1 Tax=Candidatus Raymondbacteria bacterium RIFOXYD12_FULL_49_13 TaxID=1817890 RepID=A0A1F7FF75_UNCRA|nr:MAG: guanylate kinase [Candidatus Raymondbacteria bacterium RIFOXYA2_FULL_49_16]OGK01037.1 MAG: guanylate kinase [Candidatus Raymondbacteria bacterium RifOxyB12_full_50_8]OGK03387.1 MAG: guanylate kinase [Candidatus Raymondbacteria bacterium RifOxyC12_full_50_8]OGK05345.1 MAG: guanylate kinase [Candidatus Raymondbacteria bacterium RIFOXYD12_FULL_49_13]OGP42958.1 MAG: guanylate kinase [Candidatus Raymondbacteria bacterium RIFOXYB2_FULL_49_35]
MASIFVISAPSGAGKSSLIRRIMQRFPGMVFSVSVTTRKPRPREQEGREYFFKTREVFEAMLRRNELAEWQEVHGNYYGTPKRFITDALAQGRDVIMDIDVYGKKKFDVAFPEAVGIFINAPSIAELEARLRRRNTDSDEAIATRLKNAIAEIDVARTQGKYEHTVINDSLERATDELAAIISQQRGTKGAP